jgi:acyl carrier protein
LGLDFVEIILQIEESFAISLPDEEVQAVSTVGDLQRLVSAKLTGTDASACLSSLAFCRVRRGICEVWGLDRRAVRPETPIASFAGRGGLTRDWERLAEATQLVLPALTIFARIPGEQQTVGDLAHRVQALNLAHFRWLGAGIRERDVFRSLCEIIAEQVGLTPGEIRPESRIVDDLGIS